MGGGGRLRPPPGLPLQPWLGLLDAEAKGDRDLRGKFTRRWTREASEKVNQDLVVKLTEYSKKVPELTPSPK